MTSTHSQMSQPQPVHDDHHHNNAEHDGSWTKGGQHIKTILLEARKKTISLKELSFPLNKAGDVWNFL